MAQMPTVHETNRNRSPTLCAMSLKDPNLANMITQHIDQTQQHIANLEQVFSSLVQLVHELHAGVARGSY